MGRLPAERAGQRLADPELSLSLDEAYAVQTEVARLRCAAGDAVAGYKIGCIGAGVVEQFGMSGPIHARLFRSEVRGSGETLRHEDFENPAIEGEMALRIGDDGRIVAASIRLQGAAQDACRAGGQQRDQCRDGRVERNSKRRR